MQEIKDVNPLFQDLYEEKEDKIEEETTQEVNPLFQDLYEEKEEEATYELNPEYANDEAPSFELNDDLCLNAIIIFFNKVR